MASQDRFGYEWKKYAQILPAHREQFCRWIAPLTLADFAGKRFLDVGCGMGRNSYWPLEAGAASALSIDCDQGSLASARRNLDSFPQAEVKFLSVYDLQAKDEFDLVFSIGVIHHLTDPQQAIRNMVTATKPGGNVLIWVYGYEGNEWIVKWVNPLRKRLFSRLPISLTHGLAYLPSCFLYGYLKLFKPSHPYLVLLRTFSFAHLHSIVFDQLLPEVAHYWTREQALNLLKSQPQLTDVSVHHVNNNSWTVIGTKA